MIAQTECMNLGHSTWHIALAISSLSTVGALLHTNCKQLQGVT